MHSKHNERAAIDQDVDYKIATPEATNALYGYRCVKCHNGGHNRDRGTNPSAGTTSSQPFTAELMFDVSEPKNPRPPATYVRSGAVSTYQNVETLDWFGWQPASTCQSVYCHSNGGPADVTTSYKNLTWSTQGTWNCASCHGTRDDTTTMSKAHALHTGAGTYNYGCERCHLSVASSGTALNTGYAGGGKILHVNGLKEVKFDGYAGNTAGTYLADRTCSNTYCHSTGVDRNTADGTVSGPSVAWTGVAVAPATTCRMCHGMDGTATPRLGTDSGTAAHRFHVNNTAVIGSNVGCALCHSATVSSNTAVSDKTKHVNGDPNVALATITSPTSQARTGGTYAGGACASN
jgi:predicted CxxxxCH...CXXCH cytochrome family protein